MSLIALLNVVLARFREAVTADRFAADDGFSTAELLGNAALGVAALVIIWAGMESLGVEVMAWIRGQLIS